MRSILMGIILTCITGCTKQVLVPVSSCPEPPACGGNLLVPALSPSATVQQKLEALRSDYLELKRCKILLDGYRR